MSAGRSPAGRANEWTPRDATELRENLVDLLAVATDPDGPMRVAIDGAPCTEPEAFAEGLIAPLNARGRPTAQVRADAFWRDASLRFEFGRDDVESYASWLDSDALNREVLVAARETRTYLPSLRDPETNRSTHARVRELDADAVLIVSGSLLLGRGLIFDRVIHLYAPSDLLERSTEAGQRWTLPAFARYEADVHPLDVADVAVRLGRRTPAVRGL